MAAGKFYVYHLIDPRSDEVFYVGKGCGSRISQHEIEAKKGSDHPKCDVIRAIWDEGHEVKRVKVKHFKEEQAAYDYEAEEVARIGLENLTNQQAGGGKAFCRNTSGRVEPIYAARLILKYMATAIRVKAAGYKFNSPWAEAIAAVLQSSLERFRDKYGEQFVVDELAKYNIQLVHGDS